MRIFKFLSTIVFVMSLAFPSFGQGSESSSSSGAAGSSASASGAAAGAAGNIVEVGKEVGQYGQKQQFLSTVGSKINSLYSSFSLKIIISGL